MKRSEPARPRTRRAATLRLFVAAYPPPDVATALAGLASDPALALDPLRRVPSADIHLTLQFIGDTRVRDLDDAIESVRRASSGITPFMLTPQRRILLPPRGRARVLAVETDAPSEVLELHRRLAQRFARAGRRNAADRYLPHLTIARFSGSGRSPRPVLSPGPLPIDPFPVESICLVKSVLRPGGATHGVVTTVELP